MRRVALIYNPASGRHSRRRATAVQGVLNVLRGAGVAVEAFESDTAEKGAAYARQAVRKGFDTVIACGGDGTVHEILQSLVGTEVALGVVPLGTANALAADLGLSGSPARIARILLEATPVRVPVGRIHYRDSAGNPGSKFFTVAAGMGADALLMSRLDTRLKRRLGYVLYLVEALRIWATHPFPFFEAAFTTNGSDARRVEEVTQLLAVRVRSFGGVVRRLAPGATLHNRSLCLVAFKTRSRIRFLRFLLAVIAGRHTFSREIELVDTFSVECRACNGSEVPILVEADGEVLGSLPVRIDVVPEALTLLIPSHAEP